MIDSTRLVGTGLEGASAANADLMAGILRRVLRANVPHPDDLLKPLRGEVAVVVPNVGQNPVVGAGIVNNHVVLFRRVGAARCLDLQKRPRANAAAVGMDRIDVYVVFASDLVNQRLRKKLVPSGPRRR